MPKVNSRKAAARKSANKSNRRAARRPAGAGRGGGGLKRLADGVRAYSLAGTAGAIVIAIVAGAVFWAGGYAGQVVAAADRALGEQLAEVGFDVRRVTLKGRDNSALGDIEAAMAGAIGASMLHVDLGAAQARIETLGWVRAASVTRLWPHTLHVSIRERRPAAIWQMSGALHLIDADGAVIREVGAYEYAFLPLIVGAGAPEAASEILRALADRPELKSMTTALVRVGERRWNLRLRNKTDVKLPETGVAAALEALAIMHGAQGTLDRAFEYIDLRDPERVIIRPRTEPPAG